MGTRSLAGYQPKRVWINDGAGRFVDVAQMVGVTDRHDGRSVALADFANRGVLDVVVANQRGPAAALPERRRAGPRAGSPSTSRAAAVPDTPAEQRCSNRNAIGAQVDAALERASSRCRRCPAAPASARRTSAGCTSGSAAPPTVDRAVDPLAVG